jgi:hypothetical protein
MIKKKDIMNVRSARNATILLVLTVAMKKVFVPIVKEKPSQSNLKRFFRLFIHYHKERKNRVKEVFLMLICSYF